jgi:hypothetical protein
MDHQRFRNMGLGALVIAVVLLGFGGWQARSLLWDTTTGTVESCRPLSGVNQSQTRQTQECLVTWKAEGRTHAAAVSFDGADDLSHTSQTLYVDGDNAYARRQGYLGPVLAVAGLALGLLGIALRRRGQQAQ